jgi:hypothetical protein
MALLLEPLPSLHSRVPHDILPPNHKALLLGISYLLPPEGSDSGSRPNPLEGPLNDTREMKTMLIGRFNVHSTALSLYKLIGAIDLFHYREQDIVVMTDEEKNVGTEHWPSKENIVRFVFSRVAHGCISTNTDKFIKCSCGP